MTEYFSNGLKQITINMLMDYKISFCLQILNYFLNLDQNLLLFMSKHILLGQHFQ